MATTPANWGNINMLRDTDDDAGYYAVVCSVSPNWKGAILYVSDDGGANYNPVTTLDKNAVAGGTSTALGDFPGGNVPDEFNTLVVTLYRGELSSVDYPSFINGLQAALVGNEIIYFRNAVLNMDGSYTLSGFLRGRRGTEYAIGTHQISERFVLLSTENIARIAGVTAFIGVERLYKCPSVGALLTDATAYTYTNNAVGLKPYAPVLLGGHIAPDGSAVLYWTRRTRISGEWRSNVDVPISETVESYVIEICDGTFTTIKRTVNSSVSTITYSQADQITDFGSPQSFVYFRVYQISERVGRGYASQGTAPTSSTAFI